ncbi:PA1571 family protein [Porticoccus sp. GXU_MW_L64]
MTNLSIQNNETNINFNGAAILDQNGQEVPITEEMVQDACQELVTDDQEAANG